MESVEIDILKDPRFGALMEDFLRQAEAAFRRRAKAAKLELSGAMIDSFRRGAVTDGTNFLKGNVQMLAYVRLKDMRQLSYTNYMPTDVLEYFVQKVGLENFAYVPGYERPGAKLPSRDAQIKRIAFGIQAYRKQNPTQKRKYGGIYNDPISRNIVPRLAWNTAKLAAEVAATTVKQLIEEQQ